MLTYEKFNEIGKKKRNIRDIVTPLEWEEIALVFSTCKQLFEENKKIKDALKRAKEVIKEGMCLMNTYSGCYEDRDLWVADDAQNTINEMIELLKSDM